MCGCAKIQSLRHAPGIVEHTRSALPRVLCKVCDMAMVSGFAWSAETRPPITEQNLKSQGSTKIFQRMCCHIGSVSPRPPKPYLPRPNIDPVENSSQRVDQTKKKKKVVVYRPDVYGSFYDAVSRHSSAGGWRYYKDKPDHSWGGNWRTGAGILCLSFLNAARKHWAKRPEPKERGIVFCFV